MIMLSKTVARLAKASNAGVRVGSGSGPNTLS
jgi:hypothetical protein